MDPVAELDAGAAVDEEGVIAGDAHREQQRDLGPRLLTAGDTFYEPPTAVHSTSRNPSADQRVKLLVFMVADQKNPSTVPE